MSRRSLTWTAILLGLLLVFPVLPVGATSYDDGSRILLRFKAGEFDPLTQSEPIPDILQLGESQGYFIVQFDGPVLEEWQLWLSGMGDVVAYMPDYALVVRAPGREASDFLGNSHVRHVGFFEPGYKIEPGFDGSSFVRELNVVHFKGSDTETLCEQLTALGAVVISIDPVIIVVEASGSIVERMAFIPDIQWIEEHRDITFDNNAASKTSKVRQSADGAYNWASTTALWSYNPSTSTFEGYAGANFTAAIADTGVDGTHPAFNGKKVAYYGYGQAQWQDGMGHGTHTSGTVLGNGAIRSGDSGTAGYYAGMAPLAGLVAQDAGGSCTLYNLCNDAVKNNATVSSNSWGSNNYGVYDGTCYAYDVYCRDADDSKVGNQSISLCFSAGNSGPSAGTVGTPAAGKNMMAVGATDNSGGGSMAGFSSRGPCLDGRIKPDIVAPGQALTSCRANSASSYVSMQGTSMSCPTVAGAVVIANEYYNASYGVRPSPAMVKSLLLNGADVMGGLTYPGNDQGWGRLNLARSMINTTGRKIWNEDQKNVLSTGTARNYVFNVTGSGELKISLVWTDAAGTINANPALVNNMDLTATSPSSSVYLGNVFSSGLSTTGGSADTKNNVEMVRLNNPAQGKWVINVKGTNVPQGRQDYALVIAGPIDKVEVDVIDLFAGNLTISDQNPAEGEVVTFGGTIANIGSLPLPNVRYRFTVKSGNFTTVVKTEELGNMNSTENYTVGADWVAVRGSYTAMIEIDPFGFIAENREDNNNGTGLMNVRGYGLDLACAPASLYTDPGKKADFSVQVFNKGNTIDNYSLAIETPPPGNWNASIETTQLQLGKSGNRSVRVSVTPPPISSAFDKAITKVRVKSLGNQSYTAVVNLTVTVNQVYGIGLTANTTDKWVMPGQMLTYAITVANTGNGPDSVTLAVGTPPEGWKGWLSDTYLVLQSGAASNLTMSVASPQGAVAFSAATFKISSTSGNNTKRYLNVTAKVIQIAAIELQLANGPDTVNPGDKAEYIIRIKNPGNSDDTVDMDREMTGNWVGNFADTRPKVKMGDFTLDTLTVEIPGDAIAGEHEVRINATSSADMSVIAWLNLTVKVNQFFGLSLTSEKVKYTVEAGNGTEFELKLTNDGNGVDTFILEVSRAPSSAWKTYLNVTEIKLAPKESTMVLLTVKSPGTSDEGEYSTTVLATSKGEPVKTQTVIFKVAVTVPPPTPPPPPPPPPTPPPPTPDEPVQEDISLKAKLWAYRFPLALIIALIIILGVAGGYAASRRKTKRKLELEEDTPRSSPFYEEQSAQAYSEMEAHPAYAPSEATQMYATTPPDMAQVFVPEAPAAPSGAPPPTASEGVVWSTAAQTAPAAATAPVWTDGNGPAQMDPAVQGGETLPEAPAPAPVEAPAPEPVVTPVQKPPGPPAPEPVKASVPQTAAPSPSAAQAAKKVDNDIADILSRLNELSK